MTLPPPPDIPPGLEYLLPTFVAEMTRDIARLRSIGAADRAGLAEQAHATRGKCGLFGEGVLYGLLSRLENGADTLGEDEIAAILAELAERGAQLSAYLAAVMAEQA